MFRKQGIKFPVMRYVSGVLTFLFVLVLVLFAVSNKDQTQVQFFPISDDVYTGPLFVLVFLFVFLGFLLGGFVAWNTGRKYRRAARTAQKRVAVLESDVAAMRLRAEAAEERYAQISSTRPLLADDNPRDTQYAVTPAQAGVQPTGQTGFPPARE